MKEIYTLPNYLNEQNLSIDLLKNSLIRVPKQSKAAEFLQGQITCDIHEVTPSQSKLAAICNNKGRVISIFRIFTHNEDYLIALPNTFHQPVWDHLKKYGVFSQTQFGHDKQYSIKLGITGTDAFLSPDVIPKNVDEQWSDENTVIIKVPGLNNRFEVYSSNAESLNKALAVNDTKMEKLNWWHAMDIAAGLVHITSETSEKHTPHSLNLKQLNAISFTKGCYLGQEIVAKVEHLGRVKKRVKPMMIHSVEPIKMSDDIVDAVAVRNDVWFVMVMTRQP